MTALAKIPTADVAKVDWSLLPSGKLAGDPAGSLALGMAPASIVNGGAAAQSEAAARFLAIIDPLVNAERFAELHRVYPCRADLIQHLANQNQVSKRTIYRLLQEWDRGGISGLARKMRADKGQSRVLNDASVNFIVAHVLPKVGVFGNLSNADVWRWHKEEHRWREEHAGKPLSHADRVRYAGYVDTEGRLLPSAQLSQASYATFCRGIARIPELIKLMARRGDEGHRNAETISFRDYESIQPLDYVVMDHRVLDIFCLIPERGGVEARAPLADGRVGHADAEMVGLVHRRDPFQRFHRRGVEAGVRQLRPSERAVLG